MGKAKPSTDVGAQAMDAAKSMFGTSQGARAQMFKQIQSALATGGRGMKGGFVHQAEARSTAAGASALKNAAGATTNLAPSIRGRVLNRIMQANKANTAGIAPGWANALIGQAPAAFGGAAEGQSEGYRIGAQAEGAAAEAAATRSSGIASGVASAAGPIGSAAGDWMSRYFRPTAPAAPTTTAG